MKRFFNMYSELLFFICALFFLINTNAKPHFKGDDEIGIVGDSNINLGDKVDGKSKRENEENWSDISEEYPELGEYFEGDIILPPEGLDILRNSLISDTSRWKDGIVPYVITGPFTPEEVDTIDKAMQVYHKYTCIRFRERLPSDEDYIDIVNPDSDTCSSYVGKRLGRQDVNLSPGCLKRIGTPLHELMHAIGFVHEQSRFNRDDHVTIMWKNIAEGYEKNFKKYTDDVTTSYGITYDYGSVMHYPVVAFSNNGEPTIIPNIPLQKSVMGQRRGFSRSDLTKINRMYHCDPATLEIPCRNIIFNTGDEDN